VTGILFCYAFMVSKNREEAGGCQLVPMHVC
jgi:hypothetical protein